MAKRRTFKRDRLGRFAGSDFGSSGGGSFAPKTGSLKRLSKGQLAERSALAAQIKSRRRGLDIVNKNRDPFIYNQQRADGIKRDITALRQKAAAIRMENKPVKSLDKIGQLNRAIMIKYTIGRKKLPK